jgi:hypothetical protein
MVIVVLLILPRQQVLLDKEMQVVLGLAPLPTIEEAVVAGLVLQVVPVLLVLHYRVMVAVAYNPLYPELQLIMPVVGAAADMLAPQAPAVSVAAALDRYLQLDQQVLRIPGVVVEVDLITQMVALVAQVLQ